MGNALIKYRDSRINLFQSIMDDLTTLMSINNDFNNQILVFQTNVSNFYLNVTTLNTLVND